MHRTLHVELEGSHRPWLGPPHNPRLLWRRECGELDTQVQVFSFISLVTERMADGIRPYAAQLLQATPAVWQLGEGQPLLRVQILLTLAKLVNALGIESHVAYPIVLPILKYVTDPSNDDALNLLEDGLALWLVSLRNSPTAQADLLGLFPNLVAVCRFSTEHVKVSCQIMASCILMGGVQFLQAYGTGLVDILTELMGELNERGMCVLLPVLELLVQVGLMASSPPPCMPPSP